MHAGAVSGLLQPILPCLPPQCTIHSRCPTYPPVAPPSVPLLPHPSPPCPPPAICVQSREHQSQAKAVSEMVSLRKEQARLERETGQRLFVGLSLVDTLRQCIRWRGGAPRVHTACWVC